MILMGARREPLLPLRPDVPRHSWHSAGNVAQGRNGGGWAHRGPGRSARSWAGVHTFTPSPWTGRPPRQMIHRLVPRDHRPVATLTASAIARTRSSPRTWTASSWSIRSSSPSSAAGCLLPTFSKGSTQLGREARRAGYVRRSTCPGAVVASSCDQAGRHHNVPKIPPGVRTCLVRPRKNSSSSCVMGTGNEVRMQRSWKRGQPSRDRQPGVTRTP